MTDLDLNEDSLLDFWDRRRWVTIRPVNVIHIETDYSIILRCRPSLTTDLPLDSCPGIKSRLALQSDSRMKKRSAETYLISPLKKVSRTEIEDRPRGEVPPLVPSSVPDARMQNIPSTSSAPTLQCAPATIPERPPIPPVGLALDSGPDGESLVDDSLSNVSVLSWHTGYEKIAQLKDDEHLTEAVAFPLVFGFKYVKSTACSYKRAWDCAPKEFQDAFLKLGDSKKASWKRFKTALRKKKLPTYAHILVKPSTVTSHSNSSSESVKPFPTNQLSPILPIVNLAESIVSVKREPDLASPASSDLEDDNGSDVNLCPFCDQPLPELPSGNLTAMLAALEKRTYKDPTADNPHHCTAPSIRVFAGFCARHRFETHEIPNAIASGWPMQVNFGALFDRVSRLYLHLMDVPKDGKNTFLLTAKEYYKTDQLRKQGVSAQFHRFDKFGAG